MKPHTKYDEVMGQRRANALPLDQRSIERESPMNDLSTITNDEIKYERGLGHAHMLYVIGADEDGPVKIGKSSDVAQRVMTMQVGNPMPLLVLGVRLVLPKTIPAGVSMNILQTAKACVSKVEKAVHWELHKIGLRMMGEWFDVTTSEALECIDKVAKAESARTFSKEWLASDEARLDPEYGWMREKLFAQMMNAEAQAAKVNKMGLTIIRDRGIF